MRRPLALSVLIFVFVLQSSPANADGGIFIPPYAEYVRSPSQKAAIVWDGNKESMILSTKFTMAEPEDFAWVVPVPSTSKPEVSEGDIEIFYRLTELFNPPRGRGLISPFFGGMALEGGGGVELLEEKKVDIYDIAILRATDADELVDWLTQNGYNTPGEAIPTLQYYADRENFYFIANKINLSNKYAGIEFTELERNCVEIIEERRLFYIPRLIEHIEDYKEQIQNFCGANVSIEAFGVLYGLNSGMSTPIKIEFYPEKPFYPMKMTSVNEGGVKVDVYLFSETPVTDSSNLMKTEKMTAVSKYLKENLNLAGENYVTYLAFDDDSSKMNRDSFFEATVYNVLMDPVASRDYELFTASVLVFTLLILFLGFVFAVLFVFGFLVGKVAKKTEGVIVRLVLLVLLIIAELTVPPLFLPHWYVLYPLAFFLFPVLVATSFGFFSADWKFGRKKWALTAIISLAITAGYIFMFLVFAM